MKMTSNDIFKRIFLEMNRKGISRSDIYRYTGLADNTFSTWTKRKTMPRADVLLKIADCLGVSIQWLLTGVDENGLSRTEQEIVKNYRLLDAAKKDIAKGLIAVLAERDDSLP